MNGIHSKLVLYKFFFTIFFILSLSSSHPLANNTHSSGTIEGLFTPLPYLTMNIRPTRGKELLLVIDGNKLPFEMEMYERWTPSDLQRKFPTAMVFVRNKNLHNFEWALKGSILWVPYLKKIIVVIEAHGRKAYVYQIYPVPTAASSLSMIPLRTFKMSLLLEGFYLEQIHGVPIVSQYYRPKIIHNLRSNSISELSNVQLQKNVQRIYPLVDSDSGFIKMNIAGPDLALVGSCTGIPTIVPQAIKSWFHENQWTALHRTSIYSPIDVCKTHTHCNSVHVIYVHVNLQHHFKHVIVSPSGEKLIGVPIGKPITTNSVR